MYDSQLIERTCGQDAAAYARNKHRGGRNNANGATFETYYAATRPTEALADALAVGDDGATTSIYAQQLCFIDDLIIDRPTARRLSQLKSGAASWTGGAHPLADDFRLQAALDAAAGVAAAYELVVAREDLRDALVAARPDDLDVEVVRFAFDAELDGLLAANPALVAAIDSISIQLPRPSVRRQVFKAILAAWVSWTGDPSLAAFALHAAEAPGPVVAVLGPEYELPAEVAEHLAALGMDIKIRNKHLYYRFGGLSGYSAFRGGSPESAAFERYVVERRPADVYEVVVALRGVS